MSAMDIEEQRRINNEMRAREDTTFPESTNIYEYVEHHPLTPEGHNLIRKRKKELMKATDIPHRFKKRSAGWILYRLKEKAIENAIEVPSLLDGVDEDPKQQPEPEPDNVGFSYWREAKLKAAEEYSDPEPEEKEDEEIKELFEDGGLETPSVLHSTARVMSFMTDLFMDADDPRNIVKLQVCFMHLDSLTVKFALKMNDSELQQFQQSLGVDALYKGLAYSVDMYIPPGTRLSDYYPKEEEPTPPVIETPGTAAKGVDFEGGSSLIQEDWGGDKAARKALMEGL